MVRPWKAGNYRLPKLSLITYTSELPCTRFNPFGNVPVRSGYIYIYVQAGSSMSPQICSASNGHAGFWRWTLKFCAHVMRMFYELLYPAVADERLFSPCFSRQIYLLFYSFFFLDIWVYGDPNYRGKIGEIRQRLRRG